MNHKHLFTRALSAAPDRLHFAAHSHHLWPDVTYDAQMQAWEDAASLADHKWGKVMGPVWEEAQGHIARELSLSDPTSTSFSSNTHDFLLRIFSGIEKRPVRVLATDGEFHSFRRQMARWVEAGEAELVTAAPDDLVDKAGEDSFDLIFASQVLFNSGKFFVDIERLAALADPAGPWVVVDGYHGFMAVPTDLSRVADKIFYLAGGYKYAMAGEGACFLHAPDGFAPRPVATGWYAEFDDLALPPGATGYALDGRRFLGSTFDPSGLYRFNAVQQMLRDEGLTTDKIAEYVAVLQGQFLSATPFPQLEYINPISGDHGARFLAFKGEVVPAMHAALESKGAITDVRGDVLRVGFGLYHDAQDVDALLAIIAAT